MSKSGHVRFQDLFLIHLYPKTCTEIQLLFTATQQQSANRGSIVGSVSDYALTNYPPSSLPLYDDAARPESQPPYPLYSAPACRYLERQY
jgi:hypothetical protein